MQVPVGKRRSTIQKHAFVLYVAAVGVGGDRTLRRRDDDNRTLEHRGCVSAFSDGRSVTGGKGKGERTNENNGSRHTL